MEKKLYLGVDVGTSSLKIVLNEAGKSIRTVSEKYEISISENGWSEIDPREWEVALETGIKKILEGIDHNQVSRMAITGQMHTLVMLDNNGNSVRPAIMWNDLRTKKDIKAIKNELQECGKNAYLAQIVSTGSPLASLVWVQNNEKENYDKIRYIQIGWDYLVYRLTGVHCTDYCNASTSCLFDFDNNEWSDSVLEKFELKKEILPRIYGSGQVVGYIEKEFKERLSLPDTTTVIMGTGDNPATAISAGVFWDKNEIFSMGTSGVLTRLVGAEQAECNVKKIKFSFDKKKIFQLEQGAIQSCGNTYDWSKKQFGSNEELQQIEREINPEEEIESSVLFYPHLAGEKTIYSDPDIRGMFTGINLNTTRKNMHYAVLEGICFSVKELLEKMHKNLSAEYSLLIVGGVASNALLMQILADILGCKVQKLDENIGASFGIAYLAEYADDIGNLKKAVLHNFSVKKTFIPDLKLTKLYNEKYQKYLKLRHAEKQIMK